MMQNWTPETLFYFTWAVSALTSIGIELLSNKSLTVRLVFGTAIVYGSLGAGLGAFCYEYLGGKNKPVLVVACGMLVGARAIKTKDVTNIIRRVFVPGAPANSTPQDGGQKQ